jgi:hypothetical protein
MARCAWICLVILPLAAQERVVSTRDVNGRLVREAGSDLNGRRSAREQVEERIIEDSGGRKVVERTIRRFDQQGSPLPPERVRVEETKQADGTVETTTSTYRGDVNGRLALAERRQTVVRGESSETQVERPGMSGRMELAERRVVAGEKSETALNLDEVVYRPDMSGRLAVAARTVTHQTKQGDATTEEVSEYDDNGSGLTLARQTVSRTAKRDGAEVREVDVYGPTRGDRPAEGGKLVLRGRETYETERAADGSTREVMFYQDASVSDPGKLGRSERVRETVCKGECGKK